MSWITFVTTLFWYFGERNWSVQSTATILKPRKDPYDYKAGDLVVAKFNGKPYRAAIISVKDEKEKLNDDRLKFDGFLQDASFSPNQLMEKMGLHANLDIDHHDHDKEQCSPKLKKKKAKMTEAASTKIHVGQTALKTTKSAEGIPKLQTPKQALQAEQKKRNEAALESSKLMASRLLQNKASHTPPITDSSSTDKTQHPHQ